jgi:hypothetical protein
MELLATAVYGNILDIGNLCEHYKFPPSPSTLIRQCVLCARAAGISYKVAALTKLSIPSRYNMKKKRTAHNCGIGNIVIASG